MVHVLLYTIARAATGVNSVLSRDTINNELQNVISPPFVKAILLDIALVRTRQSSESVRYSAYFVHYEIDVEPNRHEDLYKYEHT